MNRDLCVDLVFELEDTKRSSPFQTRAFCREVSLFKGLAWNAEVFFFLSFQWFEQLTDTESLANVQTMAQAIHICIIFLLFIFCA